MKVRSHERVISRQNRVFNNGLIQHFISLLSIASVVIIDFAVDRSCSHWWCIRCYDQDGVE
jgi:hypothetical protein